MSSFKILTVVGARPQLVKAAMVSRAIRNHAERCGTPGLCEEIVHTGQHYDPLLSQVFFDELGIPEPVVNLQIGSGMHGEMTGKMLIRLETEIVARAPDCVLIYGDTNSTLSAALAAAKLHVPVAHVEAGLRSFNRQMPEELNRIVADHVSDLLLCPTHEAVQNLKSEGITRGVRHVGDVMFDAAIAFGELARQRSDVLQRLDLTPGDYYLATVHRAENTDDPARLRGIFTALAELAKTCPVVLPLHPRTRKFIAQLGWETQVAGFQVIDPVPFLDMVRLEQAARVICTDSGGVQKEAYFHRIPCVTLRDETEWVETIQAGWNRLAGADTTRIVDAVRGAAPGRPIDEYGRGDAADQIVTALLQEFTGRSVSGLNAA